MDENELKELLEDFNKTANEIVKLENKRLEQDEMKNKREHTTRRILIVFLCGIVIAWIIGYFNVPALTKYNIQTNGMENSKTIVGDNVKINDDK